MSVSNFCSQLTIKYFVVNFKDFLRYDSIMYKFTEMIMYAGPICT